jgi:bifunctional non-homologous end joining protein LigD
VPAKPKRTPASAPARGSTSEEAPAEVEVTHPDRVLYPADGYTKADVAAYYRRVAPRLQPFLRDRPVTLERLPDGSGG